MAALDQEKSSYCCEHGLFYEQLVTSDGCKKISILVSSTLKLERRHDTQHNDFQHNDIQHNNT